MAAPAGASTAAGGAGAASPAGAAASQMLRTRRDRPPPAAGAIPPWRNPPRPQESVELMTSNLIVDVFQLLLFGVSCGIVNHNCGETTKGTMSK